MGSCNHCGACCQYEGLARRVAILEPGDDERYFRVRGYAVEGRVARLALPMLAPCPEHERPDPRADAGRCRIWNQRPSTCREFPQRPGQVEGFGNCSYWFELRILGAPVQRRGGPGSPYPTPVQFRLNAGEAVDDFSGEGAGGA